MEVSIFDDRLRVVISSLGAELRSIRTTDAHEYLWQGDPKSWSGRAPLLFPIVGGLSHDGYRMDGQWYPLGSHGFARDQVFDLADHQASSCRFTLTDNESTRAVYPFSFELGVEYRLAGSTLTVGYTLENRDHRSIWFSIGGHPGFRCPLEDGLGFSDYHLEFEKPEHVDRRMKGSKNLSGAREPFLRDESRTRLEHDLFARGPVVLHGLESTSVRISSLRGTRSVTVSFPGFPYLGVWSWPERADFVCIEPWFGVDSTEGDPPGIEAKEGLQHLVEGDVFRCSYAISID